MNQVKVMGRSMQLTEGMTFGEVAKEFRGEFPSAILLAKQGNVLRELSNVIHDVDDITFFDLRNEEGLRVYHRGVSFLLVKAVHALFGDGALVVIEHSLRGNLYCEIRNPKIEITEELLAKLEAKMQEYVAADIPIIKRTFRKDVAIALVKKQGMRDKAELFRFRRASNINLYEMDGFTIIFTAICP